MKSFFCILFFLISTHAQSLSIIHSTDPFSTLSIALKLKDGANANEKDHDGVTVLHLAALKNLPYAIGVLHQFGALIDARDKRGQNPLHYACANRSKEAAKELIEQGAPLNAIDDNGETPIHLAARLGHDELLKFIVQNISISEAIHSRNLLLLKLSLIEKFSKFEHDIYARRKYQEIAQKIGCKQMARLIFFIKKSTFGIDIPKDINFHSNGC